jgi:8-oxo-dGTP diphosphatase
MQTRAERRAVTRQDETDFGGAKAPFMCGDRVLCYLRDDIPGLPFAGHWDLPGGGREGSETPEDCLLRELYEEFGLRFGAERLVWKRDFRWWHKPAVRVWFFGGWITEAEIADVRFGDEGQYWEMMPVAEFIAHEKAVPDLQKRLGIFMVEGALIAPLRALFARSGEDGREGG